MKMKFEIDKINLLNTAIVATAKKDIRDYLTAVCITAEGTIQASNGYIAVQFKHGAKITENSDGIDHVLLKLPRKAIRAKYVLEFEPTEDKRYYSMIVDGIKTLVPVVDAKYPDIDAVMPYSTDISHTSTVHVNWQYVYELNKAYAKGYLPLVVYQRGDETQKILLDTNNTIDRILIMGLKQ